MKNEKNGKERKRKNKRTGCKKRIGRRTKQDEEEHKEERGRRAEDEETDSGKKKKKKRGQGEKSWREQENASAHAPNRKSRRLPHLRGTENTKQEKPAKKKKKKKKKNCNAGVKDARTGKRCQGGKTQGGASAFPRSEKSFSPHQVFGCARARHADGVGGALQLVTQHLPTPATTTTKISEKKKN
jgi:hypothetical protein